MNTETSLQTVESSPPQYQGAFSCPEAFETAQRMAKLLQSASIVPDAYKQSLPDCLIALEMANRIGANPLAVMQNLYIVHGRPAWSSQFLISCLNASRKFTPLRYKMDGDGDEYGCTAWAQDRTGERLEGPKVTMAMAKAEGWHGRNGSKWKTMPELMLRYRAATLFARLYAPELTMGLQTDDEVIDIAPVVTDPVARAKPAKSLAELRKPAPEPAADPVWTGRKAEQVSTQTPAPEPPKSEAGKEDVQKPSDAPASGPPPLSRAQQAFDRLVTDVEREIEGATVAHILAFCQAKCSDRWPAEGVTCIADIPDSVCEYACAKSATLKKYCSDLIAAGKRGGE